MPLPSTPTLDNFGRADENPLSFDGKWSSTPLYPDEGPLQVVNEAAVPTLSGADFSGSVWVEDSFTDCEAFYSLLTTPDPLGTDNFIGLWLRLRDFGTLNATGYILALHTSSTVYRAQIVRWENNAPLQLAMVLHTPQAGNRYCLQARRDELTAFVDEGEGWTELLTATDSAFTSGYLGLETQVPNAIIDNFGGGALSVASFALPSDVAERLGRTLTAAEQDQAEQVIALVTGQIVDEVDRDADWAASLSPVPSVLKALCVEKALMAITRSPGIASETLGEHSVTYTRSSDDATIFLTEREARLARQAVYGTLTGSSTPRALHDRLIDLAENRDVDEVVAE